MQDKRVWIDVDGVLLDYTRAYLKYTGLESAGITYEGLLDYDLTKLFESDVDAHTAMTDFHNSPEFARLPCLINKHSLYLLVMEGFSLQLITQLQDEGRAREYRMANLMKHFGLIPDKVHFTERGQCKLDYIERLYPGEEIIIVEDNPNLLNKIEDRMMNDLIDRGTTNIQAYAVVHPYNMEYTRIYDYVIPVRSFDNAAVAIVARSNG